MSKKERASKAEEPVAVAEAPIIKPQAERPSAKRKISLDLIIPISVNGKVYSGHVVIEDSGLAETIVEMHEKARSARLQEQTGKVNEILKIGGRLVIKEVK